MIIIGRNGEITDDSKQDIPKPVPPPVVPTAPPPVSQRAYQPMPPQAPPVPPGSTSPSPVNPFKPDSFIKAIDDSPAESSNAPEGLPGAMPADQDIPLIWPITQAPTVPPAASAPGSSPAIVLPPTPATPPAPVMPPPRPIVTAAPAAPIFKAPPPIPPVSPIKTPPAAAPVQTPPAAPHGFSLKNIRTYESDVADVLAQRNTTRASIAIAENAKKGEGQTLSNSGPSIVTSGAAGIPAEKSHFVRNTVIVAISLLLIAGGMVAGYYLYSQSAVGAKPPAVTRPRTPPALIPYETQSVIATDDQTRQDLIRKVRVEIAKNLAPGSVREIVMTEVKEGQTYRVSAAPMSNLMGMAMPDIIARSLTPEWMLGVYAGKDDKTAFVIANTNLFQNAFAGMLGWESALPAEIKDILTDASDKSFSPPLRGTFKDQIVRNKDVRAFVTDDERTVLVYSFVDNSTLVVAANTEALAAVISRLENKAFVR